MKRKTRGKKVDYGKEKITVEYERFSKKKNQDIKNSKEEKEEKEEKVEDEEDEEEDEEIKKKGKRKRKDVDYEESEEEEYEDTTKKEKRNRKDINYGESEEEDEDYQDEESDEEIKRMKTFNPRKRIKLGGKVEIVSSQRTKQKFDESDPKRNEVDITIDFDSCYVCGRENPNTLKKCSTCHRNYHINCIDPPVKQLSADWICPVCQNSKCEKCGNIVRNPVICKLCKANFHQTCVDSTVDIKQHWVCQECKEIGNESPKIDKIIGSKISGENREYYVKFENSSYLHCKWVPESWIKRVSMSKFRGFQKTNPDDDFTDIYERIHHNWLKVDRILEVELQGKETYYYVKWQALQYDQCTWETELPDVPNFKEALEKFQIFSTSRTRKPEITPAQFKKWEFQPSYFSYLPLHPYQIEGINWLRFSWFHNTNVILADEMGLGKTVQTVAALATLIKEYNNYGPFLIVAPLSTLKHWEREFQSWAPFINCIVYGGSQESRKIIRNHEFHFKGESKKLCKFNVLLTSYEMIVQDSSKLKVIKWKVLVVDEAHRLKSVHSKLFQILNTFQSAHRLLLTGTPLQNNLSELFNLLNFINPDHFDSLEEFEREFASLNKEEQIAKLHNLLKPHILRRLKADVIDSILPKTELIVRVELSSLQKKVYRAILTKNYEVLNRKVKGSSQVSFLNIVMELKKCCNHPYLFRNTELPTSSEEESFKLLKEASGKLIILDRMLEKLKRDNHRVLIFSQMTTMLDILEDYLNYKNYKYQRLDGAVTGELRQHRIDAFNDPNSEDFVFLLSTRAGGLGINLASADTVFIYDSDWNPHNDIQALSRAHRIGQSKKVMIYRLVSRGSVEERIIQIAKSKLILDHLVVSKMNGKGEVALKAGELEDILKFGAKEIFEEKGENSEIQYDEELIEKLLDRSQVSTEKTEFQNEYLQSFKVASYVTSSLETENTMMEENNQSVIKPSFDWESLLKESWEKMNKENQLPELGKRRERKKVVKYTGLDEDKLNTLDPDYNDEEQNQSESEGGETEPYSDSKPSSKKISKSKKNDTPTSLDLNTSIDSVKETKKRKKTEIPTTSISGQGGSLLICGFNSAERLAFLKTILSFGLGDETFYNLPYPEILRKKTPMELFSYGRLFLTHLLEPSNDNSDFFQDGLPKEGMNSKEVLERVAKIFAFTRLVVMKDFNIDDNGLTELHKFWESGGPWTKQHDQLLLRGIIKHGYGKFPEILADPELGFIDVIRQVYSKETSLSQSKCVSFLKKRTNLLEDAINVEFQFIRLGQKPNRYYTQAVDYSQLYGFQTCVPQPQIQVAHNNSFPLSVRKGPIQLAQIQTQSSIQLPQISQTSLPKSPPIQNPIQLPQTSTENGYSPFIEKLKEVTGYVANLQPKVKELQKCPNPSSIQTVKQELLALDDLVVASQKALSNCSNEEIKTKNI